MTTEIIYWKNLMTGAIRIEVRQQLSSIVWKSLTDGRLYTKGVIGWYDITDINHSAKTELGL